MLDKKIHKLSRVQTFILEMTQKYHNIIRKNKNHKDKNVKHVSELIFEFIDNSLSDSNVHTRSVQSAEFQIEFQQISI